MTIFRFSSALIAAVCLGGCSADRSDNISDEDLICHPSPGFIKTFTTNPDDQVKLVEICIHKWAYRLGRAPGSNAEIAKATIAACREPIDQLLDLKVKEGNRTKQPFTDDVWKLFEKRFDDNALYRVTQGRAGQCSIRGPEQK